MDNPFDNNKNQDKMKANGEENPFAFIAQEEEIYSLLDIDSQEIMEMYRHGIEQAVQGNLQPMRYLFNLLGKLGPLVYGVFIGKLLACGCPELPVIEKYFEVPKEAADEMFLRSIGIRNLDN